MICKLTPMPAQLITGLLFYMLGGGHWECPSGVHYAQLLTANFTHHAYLIVGDTFPHPGPSYLLLPVTIGYEIFKVPPAFTYTLCMVSNSFLGPLYFHKTNPRIGTFLQSPHHGEDVGKRR